jgi:hypothetical protein
MEQELIKDVTIVFNMGWHGKKIICTCGHSELFDRYNVVNKCPSCDNQSVKTIQKKDNKKNYVIDEVFNVKEKADNSFDVEKIQTIATIDFENNTISKIRRGNKFRLRYHLGKREINFWKNDVEYNPTERRIETMFESDSDYDKFISTVSTEKSIHLYNIALKYLSAMNYEKLRKLSRALIRLLDYPSLQIFAFSGFGENLNSIWGEYTWKNTKETKPHEILGIPKYALPYIKRMNSFSRYMVQPIAELDKKFDGNTVKTVLEILEEESSIAELRSMDDLMIQLYDYGYKDIKKLILYLVRDVKLQQGISSPSSACSLLRDYVRMCKTLGLDFDKFPKSLKKDHDIVLMNYKATANENKNRMFKEVVSDEVYKKLEYENDQYAIVLPQQPKDLIDEGSSLSHCVASYVDDVINHKCKIVFLREKNYTDMSLVTVEVRGSNIRQVKGRSNRKASASEINFVNEWAKERELVYGTY